VTVRTERLLLRPLESGDVERLAEIAAEPEVRRWWRDVTADDVQELVDGREGVVGLAVERDGELVGMIQYHEETDPDYRHAGIDLFLASAHQGEGLGREAVGGVVRHLIHDLGHHRITIDPAVANERAIRCYASVGFRPVGVMRRYERGLDGDFHDGLLMELVVDPS
jgi:aminoglycoside 6'-N-acetyltransferase